MRFISIMLTYLTLSFGGVARSEEPVVGNIYLAFDRMPGYYRFDLPSGYRESFDISTYPAIINSTGGTVAADGTLLMLTYNAIQYRSINRINPLNGDRTLIAGDVIEGNTTPRGTGPMLPSTIHQIINGPDDKAYIVYTMVHEGISDRSYGLMEVELSTGNRRIVTQSGHVEVGTGHSFTAIGDFTWYGADRFLISDRFQGLVEVRLSTGERSLWLPNPGFRELPFRFDLLPDGRIVHHLDLDGASEIWVFNPETRTDEVLSRGGLFPVGKGPDFGYLNDIVTDDSGNLYVHCYNPSTLFYVETTTGNRTIISGGPENVGGGEEMPDVFSPVSFMPMRTKPIAPRTTWIAW